MPLSNVPKELKAEIRRCGFTALALALDQLIESGHFGLAGMIIVSLCLAPRRTDAENNGILAVLRKSKLRQKRKETVLLCDIAISDSASHSTHFDKIGATLVATGWWKDTVYRPILTDPSLGIDDNEMHFVSARNKDGYFDEITLCSNAGSGAGEHSPHFRFLTERESSRTVRAIGRRVIGMHKMSYRPRALPNGYYDYLIPRRTILYGVNNDMDGRTLEDVLKPGIWYNSRFQPDTPLDLTDQGDESVVEITQQS